MEFGINEALLMVEESTADELRQLTREELMAIMGALGPVNFQEFLFAKNVKIFGGINEYVEDYFAKNTINKVRGQSNATKNGTVAMLKKMLTYGNITEANKRRVAIAITELSPASAAAAAAAGSRRRKGRRSQTKRRKNRI